MTKKLWCVKEKKEIPYALYNGYGVGDTLLEDVHFKVSLDKDGNFEVIINPEDTDYFEQFNTEFWYKKIRKVLNESLIDNSIDDELFCENCNSNVIVKDD